MPQPPFRASGAVGNDAGVDNWAGNITYDARRVHEPTSPDELSALVAGSEAIRALGTRHSFSRVADTTGDLVSLARMPRDIEVDAAAMQVVVPAALRYGEVAAALHAQGRALRNLGSLPHISVAGAVATGTHGSGTGNQGLASSVAALELVTADGAVLTLRRGDPEFAGSVVSLGALGIVSRLTLDLVPAYDVFQVVYDDLQLRSLIENLDEILTSAYSASVFTDWRSPVSCQVWRKHLAADADPPATWLGARRAGEPRHPVPGMPSDACTEQLGVPGPWHERLPHFRLDFTPSSGEELQTEYLVDRADAVPALRALVEIAEPIAAVLQISEIRTVAAEDLWLSPAYARDSVALHFTWDLDVPAVLPVVALVEERLAPFAPRPHWGKVVSQHGPALLDRYPRASDFAALMRRLDPDRTFANAYVDDLFAAIR